MQILINRGRNESKSINLNYLAKTGNVYIMDNHLAAFWCWTQELDPAKDYSLTHIDAHHDMCPSTVKETFHLYKNLDFKSLDINSCINLKVNTHQAIRWDNYIEMYLAFNPWTIKHISFITPQKLPRKYRYLKQRSIKSWVNKELSIQEEVELEHPRDNFKVLNLDIDVLFKELAGNRIKKLLSDRELEIMGNRLNKMIRNSAVTTIALSPECCGGWQSSIDMFNKLNVYLDINCKNLNI